MRTTLNLDTELLKAAKERAASQGRTLTSILEEAIRNLLAPPDGPPKRVRIRLLTRKGRIVPGVDFADRDALYDRMEGRG